MKKTVSILLIALGSATGIKAQPAGRFTTAVTVGTAVGMSEPSSAPLLCRITGYYNFGRRFSAGAGTGLSFYEKTLIPVFAAVKYRIARPRRWTPYAECSAGYAFAPGRKANGGLYAAPAVGMEYALRGSMKILFAVGYEWQNLERFKQREGRYFTAGFCEKLRHRSISVRAGILF